MQNPPSCSLESYEVISDWHTPMSLQWRPRPRPHYAEGIWKRRFHSKKSSNVFRPHYAGEIWKRNSHRSFWICVWVKLVQGIVIIVTLSFSKSFVSKMFSVHAKTQSRRFQIAPAPFSWRIIVDGKWSSVVKFPRSSVDGGYCREYNFF